VALVGLVMGWFLCVEPVRRTDFVAVFLHASRGIEGLAVAQAPAGKPLALTIDLTELPALPSYRLEIVSATGKPVWQVAAGAHEGKISQLTHGLKPGKYYVRLYTANGQLLREFGLRID